VLASVTVIPSEDEDEDEDEEEDDELMTVGTIDFSGP
jgi:hypothetical protein